MLQQEQLSKGLKKIFISTNFFGKFLDVYFLLQYTFKFRFMNRFEETGPTADARHEKSGRQATVVVPE